MFVRVDTAAETTTLEEPGDCTRFHVELIGSDDALAATLGDVGRVDGKHVWVSPGAVRRLAVGQVNDNWESDFAGMVGYATSKGWVDDAGAIRAHIEHPV
ncbi:MAG: hypothetical protein GY745_09390 [Actinomycetia bacterium]|nr:hypothetical protein [Actinomycetes bacterium]MCP3913609.1 hypothetical protein [Actinomycetes bacterium]MCP4085246.1 hypothetical protein [Actinomycetes bacterium]